MRKKFEHLREFCKGKLDMLFITETELDSSFSTAQFHIPGQCCPYRLDCNSHGGGILFYIREDISSKLLVTGFEEEVEAIIVEINLRKRKWLLAAHTTHINQK